MESKLIQDKTYPEMYRIEWPDGEISDMVNKTRAKEAIRCYEEAQSRNERRQAGRGPRKARGAFK